MKATDLKRNQQTWFRGNLCLQVVIITIVFFASASNGRSLHASSQADEGWEVKHSPAHLPESPSLCAQCPPGYGVAAPCLIVDGILVNDTLCEPCPQGSFSSGFGTQKLCNLCSECPIGFYKQTRCMPMQDVRCKPCAANTPGAFGNEEFLRKCESAGVQPPREEDAVESSGEEGSILEPLPTINPFQTLTDIQDGSGQDASWSAEEELEGGLQEELIPVSTRKPRASLDESITTGDSNRTWLKEEAEAASGNNHSGSFQWPVLLAAIAAAIVFFVVGILVSQCVKQTDSSPEKQARCGSTDGMVETRLIQTPNNHTKSPLPNDEEDVCQPLNTAFYEADSPPRETQAIEKNESRGLHKNRRNLDNSTDVRFIDEDSDDEIVRHLGRPPSIHY